jgi:N-acetylglucosamine kinase-like BadF-type ATPase
MAVMTRNWTVGVDAGGTWLRVLAADGRGRRLIIRRPASQDLRAALGAVWRRRGLGRAGVAHLVVATRGVWTASERRAAAASLRSLARRVTVLSDAEAAHLGALGGRPGLLVLAGTGSIVLGRGVRGRWVRAGGLGPLFGDGGSAFALARDWLAAADPARARRLAHAPDAVARIAALAPRVLRLARQGRGPARLAVTRGALALALTMLATAREARLSPPISVSWAGSLLEDSAYRSRVWRAARGLGLSIAPVAPRESALQAAARLARAG